MRAKDALINAYGYEWRHTKYKLVVQGLEFQVYPSGIEVDWLTTATMANEGCR